MADLKSIEEDRHMVEEANKELNLDQIGIQMDAANGQDQADSQQEGYTEHPEYIHLDTDGIDQPDSTKHAVSIFKKIVIPPLSELRKETQALNRFQREAVNIMVKYAKDLLNLEGMEIIHMLQYTSQDMAEQVMGNLH